MNVNVNSTYTAFAASAIVNHYGYNTVPIGLPRPFTNITSPEPFGNEYASKVAAEFSGGSVPFGQVNKTWDPVELYRKTLAEAKNNSVTIVSIGFMGSLSGLLNRRLRARKSKSEGACGYGRWILTRAISR